MELVIGNTSLETEEQREVASLDKTDLFGVLGS